MSLKKLRPVETLTQVDKIELSLEEYFRTENFGPGDSIPKEVDLAEAMGVSRTAIREAISRFRMLGIIESRKIGDGDYPSGCAWQYGKSARSQAA